MGRHLELKELLRDVGVAAGATGALLGLTALPPAWMWLYTCGMNWLAVDNEFLYTLGLVPWLGFPAWLVWKLQQHDGTHAQRPR